jgi:hypothetical protein
MTMPRTSDALIAELVNGLEPVRPLRFGDGLLLALAAAGITAAMLLGIYGVREDVATGLVDPMHLVATGLFFGLALAATVTVVVMGRPQVGSDHSGWRWAAAMAGLLPAAGVIVAAARGVSVFSGANTAMGLECLEVGIVSSLLVFAMLVLWLRRGAPTAPGHAGLVAGIAAGAFGVFTYSLHCPANDIVHIGIWHSAVVLAMGLAGRMLVPGLIKW